MKYPIITLHLLAAFVLVVSSRSTDMEAQVYIYFFLNLNYLLKIFYSIGVYLPAKRNYCFNSRQSVGETARTRSI